MIGVHWADGHVEWLRAQFPELVATPFYVRTASELPGITEPSAVAWTNTALDVRLRPILDQRGQWFGRGVAIVVEDGIEFFAMDWPEQLGILVHETAHGFNSWDSPQRHADFQWTAQDEWLAQPGNSDRVCLRLGIDPVTDEEASIAHHGPTFTRAVLHAWWRCRGEISLDQVRAFSLDYGSPDPLAALSALDEELRTGGSILATMRSPMPEAFAKLWK